jgi:hypothetical protein
VGLLFAPILFVAVVVYVAYPLLKDDENDVEEPGRADSEGTLVEKEEIIDILRDIEMDFRMGKLSQEDYDTLKADYELRAVKAFEKLQSHQEEGRSSGDRARS